MVTRLAFMSDGNELTSSHSVVAVLHQNLWVSSLSTLLKDIALIRPFATWVSGFVPLYHPVETKIAILVCNPGMQEEEGEGESEGPAPAEQELVQAEEEQQQAAAAGTALPSDDDDFEEEDEDAVSWAIAGHAIHLHVHIIKHLHTHIIPFLTPKLELYWVT